MNEKNNSTKALQKLDPYIFTTINKTVAHLKNEELMLTAITSKNNNHKTITDQDFPTRFIGLDLDKKPLFILGGMGPAAGLATFEYALAMTQHHSLTQRSIYLLQLTQAPDRTAVILAKTKHNPATYDLLHNTLVYYLRAGFSYTKKILTKYPLPIQTIVSCSTAHYFLDDVLADKNINNNFEIISLINSVIKPLKISNAKPLLCVTTGTKITKLYSSVLSKAKIDFVNTTHEQQDLLHKSIYTYKACNYPLAIAYGTKFFQEIMASNNKPTAILAGCSELPELLKLLENANNHNITKFLQDIPCFNPIHYAVQQALTGN